MLKNYFKIAFRNLLKSKFYSFINIVGLAVGIACCLLIMLFVQDELSYDKHHPYAERLYRVNSDIDFGGEHSLYPLAPAPMAETLQEEFPEIELAGRLRPYGNWLIKVTDPSGSATTYNEEKLAFADQSILQLFAIDMIKGNKDQALVEPNSLVISRKIAEKYFQQEDPLGKMLVLDGKENYMVTGVFEEIAANTHFDFEILASMESFQDSKEGIWLSHNYNTYIRLSEHSDPASVEEKFPALTEKYLYPQASSIMGLNTAEFDESPIKYFLQPVQDIHLHSDLEGDLAPNGDIKYVYIFSAIAIFILVIACINFMNLSTARSAKRAKEVGIRKVMGSVKNQLVGQFLSESFFLGLLGLLLGIGLMELFLPAFNNLAGKSLSVNYLGNGFFVVAALVLLLFIGLVAGAYPSFYLSSFEPAKVLKGGVVKGGAGNRFLRSGLVVFQFAISIMLIVGTVIIYKQIDYIQNKSLGFNKEQVLVLRETYGLGSQIQSFKNELVKHPQILNATISGFLPVGSIRNNNPLYSGAVPQEENSVAMQNWYVDQDYISTLGLEIVEGRGFREGSIADSSSVILNESAVRKFGFENPIGEKIYAFNFSANRDKESEKVKGFTIVGVLKDFHFSSLKENISPLGLYLGSSSGAMSLRIQTENIPELLAFVEEEWNKIADGQPFSYEFLDQKFDQTYQAEVRIGKITAIFTSLAIIIACLGLFALAAFTAEQRTKEIGVRKVLGASVSDVVFMLSKEFTKLVAVAFVIAVPLSWFLMNEWLTSFAYRIDIGLEVFLISGGLALVIALITISYQTIGAALLDPVKSLKTE